MAINHVAVIVTAIVGMVIGALWYSKALFGSTWMKLTGMTDKKLKEMQKKGMTKSYVLGFVSLLVMSYILAYFLKLFDANTMGEGVATGFLIWLGFVATVMLNSVLWEGKPFKLYFINALHYLVALVIMGVILVAWT
jgi:hypothetical protein